MRFLQLKNNAETTLKNAINSTDTTITLADGGGSTFPSSNFTVSINSEIILISSRSTDTLTVASGGRGYEGTTASSHTAGSLVQNRITQKVFQQLQDNLNKRVYSTTSAASLTPEIDNYDIFEFTALAANLTINNHSTSSPANGEMMMFIIKDNGTSRTITWGNKYVSGCATLPTATTISKKTWVLVQWNNTDEKWYCISVGTQS